MSAPIKPPTPATGDSPVRVVAALIERDGRYLITQRREEAVLPLLWEFPGGRVEEGESEEEALKRELRHRLGVEATIGTKVAENEHQYERYRVRMILFSATIPEGDVHPVSVRDARWVKSAELADYRFPDADQRTMDTLLGKLDPARLN